MKLGFVSAILGDQPLHTVLATARDNGLRCVELMCWPVGRAERRYAGVTHVDVETLTPEQAVKIRQLCTEHDVEISALGYYPNPLSADEAEAATCIEHLFKVIASAPLLGIHTVNTFIGRDPARSLADNWKIFDERWPAIVKHAEAHGVRLGIENCPMFFTQDEWPGGKNLATSPSAWREMFSRIPSSHLGLNYDPSHLIWQQMDHLAPIREFADRFVHVHAKDVRVDRRRLDDVGILATPLEYHCPKLPGLGDISWGRFFCELGEAGYNGPVCIEVEDRAFEASLDTRQHAIRQSTRFLRQFLTT